MNSKYFLVIDRGWLYWARWTEDNVIEFVNPFVPETHAARKIYLSRMSSSYDETTILLDNMGLMYIYTDSWNAAELFVKDMEEYLYALAQNSARFEKLVTYGDQYLCMGTFLLAKDAQTVRDAQTWPTGEAWQTTGVLVSPKANSGTPHAGTLVAEIGNSGFVRSGNVRSTMVDTDETRQYRPVDTVKIEPSYRATPYYDGGSEGGIYCYVGMYETRVLCFDSSRDDSYYFCNVLNMSDPTPRDYTWYSHKKPEDAVKNAVKGGYKIQRVQLPFGKILGYIEELKANALIDVHEMHRPTFTLAADPKNGLGGVLSTVKDMADSDIKQMKQGVTPQPNRERLGKIAARPYDYVYDGAYKAGLTLYSDYTVGDFVWCLCATDGGFKLMRGMVSGVEIAFKGNTQETLIHYCVVSAAHTQITEHVYPTLFELIASMADGITQEDLIKAAQEVQLV